MLHRKVEPQRVKPVLPMQAQKLLLQRETQVP